MGIFWYFPVIVFYQTTKKRRCVSISLFLVVSLFLVQAFLFSFSVCFLRNMIETLVRSMHSLCH